MSGKRTGWADASLAQLGEEIRGSVVPSAGATYELYSVPAFPTRRPEVLDGSEIRSAKRPVRPGDVLLCNVDAICSLPCSSGFRNDPHAIYARVDLSTW
jgi:type I restriction enzyme, S subunit